MSPSLPPTSPTPENPPTRLTPGASLRRTLAGGGADVYLLSLETGQYARVTVVQQGIDVALRLFAPGGERLTHVDSPTGTAGAEVVSVAADTAGEHRLEVVSEDPSAPPGRYELRLDGPRPSSAADRARVAAERVFHRGEALRRDRQPAAALPLYEEALAGWRAAADPEGQAQARYRLGWMHHELGEIAAAEEPYRAALAYYRETGDEAAEAALSNRLGQVLTDLGDTREAEDLLRRAEELFRRLGSPRGQADALEEVGHLYTWTGRVRPAFAAYEQAHTVRAATGDRRGEARLELAFGDLYLSQHRLEEAHDRFEHGEALVLHKLAQVAWQAGNPRRAYELHSAALPLLETTGDRASAASARYGAGRALRALGETWEAKELLEAATEATEQLRREPARHDLRLSYFASRHHYWALLIDTLMELHREHPESGFDTQAFLAAEKARARNLLDRLTEAGADLRRDADPALMAREQEIEEQLNLLELNRLRQREAGAAEARLAALDTEERRLLNELARARAKMTTESPRYPELLEPSPVHLAALRNLLGEETVLLAYFLGDERSFLWRLSGRDERTVRGFDLPPRRQIESQAHEVRALLQQVSRVAQPRRDRALRRLGRTLLGPVAGELGTQRLLIVADGALHQLPFAALADPAAEDGAVSDPEHRGRGQLEDLVTLQQIDRLARPVLVPQEEGGRKLPPFSERGDRGGISSSPAPPPRLLPEREAPGAFPRPAAL
jgi:tetratricopeptide (TPR) repeat protein